jgi:hypothetical protein
MWARVSRDFCTDICDSPLYDGNILAIVNFQAITEMGFRSALDFVYGFRIAATEQDNLRFQKHAPYVIIRPPVDRAAHFRVTSALRKYSLGVSCHPSV